MSIHLENKDLINVQQMEVAVNGPDGATHLIICTGVADLGAVMGKEYTFLVGPKLSKRQYVGVITSGALATIQEYDRNTNRRNANVELGADLISINAHFDEDAGQVKVKAVVSSSTVMTRLAISYNVSILAELPMY